jgi:hypothetical protein
MRRIQYIYMGRIERGTGKSYSWRQGYSRNGNTYPWLTRREASEEAEAEGAKAVFVFRTRGADAPAR